MRSVLVLACVTLVLGCGGDDDDASGDAPSGVRSEPGGDPEASSALSTAGDAEAAQGSELEEPPGEVQRMLLDGFGEVAIAITDSDGEVEGWCVLLADTVERRQRGLMEVEDLQGYPGMLFVWDVDTSSSFYMRNTPTPLSIAWFDDDGRYVSEADMEPCGDREDCPLYSPEPSGASYRFALEVPQGQLPALGVGEGSVLRVGGDCAPREGST